MELDFAKLGEMIKNIIYVIGKALWNLFARAVDSTDGYTGDGSIGDGYVDESKASIF